MIMSRMRDWQLDSHQQAAKSHYGQQAEGLGGQSQQGQYQQGQLQQGQHQQDQHQQGYPQRFHPQQSQHEPGHSQQGHKFYSEANHTFFANTIDPRQLD